MRTTNTAEHTASHTAALSFCALLLATTAFITVSAAASISQDIRERMAQDIMAEQDTQPDSSVDIPE